MERQQQKCQLRTAKATRTQKKQRELTKNEKLCGYSCILPPVLRFGNFTLYGVRKQTTTNFSFPF